MAHICSPLLSLLQQQPRQTIITCEGRTATAAQLHNGVALLSWGLRHLLHLAPGQRVALAGLNSDALFAALLGVADAGCLAVPLHWRWSVRETAAALAATAPALLLADEACSELAAAAVAELQQQHVPLRVIQLTPGLLQHPGLAAAAAMAASGRRSSDGGCGIDMQTVEQLLTAAAEHHQQHQQRVALALAHAPGGGALVAFTSGSTGAAKGALLSHAALMHQSLAKLGAVGFCRADVALHLPPLAHVGGLSSALAVLVAGGVHVFLPRYSGAAALRLIKQHQVTALIAVPAMMQDIVAAAAGLSAAATLPGLARVLVGAGGMAPQLAAAVRALFPAARLTTAYGMTEAASSITFISLQQQQQLMAAAAAAPGCAGGRVCVGLPAPGVAVAIDPLALQQHQQQQQGSSCSSKAAAAAADAGVVGEVLTCGPQLMAAYWGQPDATRQAVTADGWLRTGDLGCLDAAGRLWLAGRLGDVVRSGGESVAAAAVEAALLAHPGLAAAAVVGLPHARLGEQVAAAVVLRPGWSWTRDVDDMSPAAGSSSGQMQQQQQVPRSVSAAGLRAACRAAGLAGYKLPRVMVPLQQLPLTSSGKVAKPKLRQQLLLLSLDDNDNERSSGGGGRPCSRL